MSSIELELAKLKSQFDALEKSADLLGNEVKHGCAVMKNQTEMLNIAFDELLALVQTEAIPLFFRKQILGTLTRIQAIGLPS